MLPKEYRLPHSSRLGKTASLSHPLFLIKYKANQQETSRFGIVISKKVDKRATARNRMRRVLHTYIHTHLASFPKGYDFLIVVKQPFTNLTESDTTILENELDRITE